MSRLCSYCKREFQYCWRVIRRKRETHHFGIVKGEIAAGFAQVLDHHIILSAQELHGKEAIRVVNLACLVHHGANGLVFLYRNAVRETANGNTYIKEDLSNHAFQVCAVFRAKIEMRNVTSTFKS